MLGWAQTSLFNRHISFPIASWRVSDTVDDRAARQRDRLERWYDRKFVESKSYIWVRVTPCSSTDWDQLSSGKLCVGILEDRLNVGQQWWPAAPGVGSMNITSRLQKWFFFCLALVRQHGVQYHQHYVGYFPLCISWIWFFFFVSGQGQSLPQSTATHPMADMEKTETDRSQTCMVTEVGTLESLMRYERGLLSM